MTKQQPLADFFMARLERLCRLRREYRDDLNPDGARLLNRAILATMGDAFDQGAASSIIGKRLQALLPEDLAAEIRAMPA